MGQRPSWKRNWEEYKALTAPFRFLFPEYLEAGLLFCRPHHASALSHRTAHYLRRIQRFLFTPDRAPELTLKCELVLAYHAKGGHVRRPFQLLAERLGRRHPVLLLGPDGAWLCDDEGTRPRAATLSWLSRSMGWRSRVWATARGGSAAVILCLHAAVRGNFPLSLDFARASYELSRSALRRRMGRHLLETIGCRALLVSHERFPLGGSLLLSDWIGERVLYSHGTPTGFEVPLLSQRVLVWNDTARRMWRDLLHGEDKREIQIVGNSELDLILRSQPEAQVKRNVAIFLSECTPDDEALRRDSSTFALEWLQSAAARLPEWEFWIKERDYGDRIVDLLSGERESGRIRILSAGKELGEVLAMGAVRAVLAFSSSGLFVAAGAGAVALRLKVPGAEDFIPLLDEVSVPIRGEEELIACLESIAEGTFRGPTEGKSFGAVGTMDRIEQFCLSLVSSAYA